MLGLLTHIPSVCIEDTGFGSCVVPVKFLESDMFIDTKGTPIVFRRGVSTISRYLDAFYVASYFDYIWGLHSDHRPLPCKDARAFGHHRRPQAVGNDFANRFGRGMRSSIIMIALIFGNGAWLSEIEIKNGEQEGIRTPGLQLRRLLPYPD